MKLIANKYKEKDIIKILREWTELTQKEFGKSIGYSEATIQSYERGVRKYNFETLIKIAKTHNYIITIEKKK